MKNARKYLSTSLEIKIAEDFNKIAMNLKKKPATLMRELIIGVVEDRVRITPSENIDTKFHRNLYT